MVCDIALRWNGFGSPELFSGGIITPALDERQIDAPAEIRSDTTSHTPSCKLTTKKTRVVAKYLLIVFGSKAYHYTKQIYRIKPRRANVFAVT